MPAIESGMNALKQVTEIPFPEFTARLINGTFDAILATTLKQMEAYSALVANLSKTLAQFQSENVSDSMITNFLIDNYPGGDGGTAVRDDYTFADVGSVTALDQHDLIWDSLHNKFSSDVWTAVGATEPGKSPSFDASTKKWLAGAPGLYRKAVAYTLAGSMMDQLRAMATQGFTKIVFNTITLKSSLTFKVQTTDVETKSSAAVNTARFGAYANGNAGFKCWGVKAGASYGSLSVRVANESTYSNVTMTAEILGSVEITAHTDYFPQLPASSVAAAPAPTLSDINPTHGAANASVVLTGTNLTADTIVKFGDVKATLVGPVSSDGTSMTVTAPTQTGTPPPTHVHVTASNSNGASGPQGFDYA